MVGDYLEKADFRTYKKESIKSLKAYTNNSRVHSDEQINKVVRSIKEFGFTNPVLIDEKNNIIAGHCRVKAAEKLGLEYVPCVVLEGLTEDQKKAYVIADNKLALDADWDFGVLKSEIVGLQDNDFDIDLTGFNLDELAGLLDDDEQVALCDEDELPDAPDEPKTNIGDVWLMGEHRLMCGDSTSVDAVDRLMSGAKADMVFTDPPYNTGMTPQKGCGGLGKGNKKEQSRLSHMFNDSYTPEEWQDFLASFMSSCCYLMKENSVAYICLDWRRNHELVPFIESCGFKRSNVIVWDKVVHGLGSDYKYTYELINVCKKGNPALNTHQGDREYSDVWHIQRVMGKNDDHATAKPVELVERTISHATKKGDLVVDLFGGSGTTLIACEKLNRKCCVMELEPSYCDVIIRRYEKYTGKKALLEKKHDN